VVEVTHTTQPPERLNVHCALLVHVAAVHKLAALVAVEGSHLVECLAGNHVEEIVLVVCCGVRLDGLLRLAQRSLLVEVLVGLQGQAQAHKQGVMLVS
jgi:hypothetical protein